jgi:hypothetical protein
MPRFVVAPMPTMECQTFQVGKLHRYLAWIIDPTCGRYCLKSLLKHWHERTTGIRAHDAVLAPTAGYSRFIAFDPFDDFPANAELLIEERQRTLFPQNLDDWIALMTASGPVILNGILGRASVSHFILLIGADSDSGEFIFKDPLVGDAEGRAGFAAMQGRIDTIVYAGPNMVTRLAQNVQFPVHPE